MTDRPLTTGEGNTAERVRSRAEHALTAWGEPYQGDGNLRSFTEALARDALALLAECGRLRAWHEEWVEATARAHGRLREQLALTEKQRRIFEELAKLNASERADKAEAKCDALREQLAAQQKRAENLEQRGSEFAAMFVEAEALAGHLQEQLDVLVALPSEHDLLHNAVARAMWEIARNSTQGMMEGPALDEKTCPYCMGKGGRRRFVYSRFIGAGPQVHEGPWETCWRCRGTGKFPPPTREQETT